MSDGNTQGGQTTASLGGSHLAEADIGEFGLEDFGLVCGACNAVTIFSAGARHPRCCARCATAIEARRA